jgi:cyclomaltodextrinase / maltogenic alpha-amylase / neopullulanase
MNWTDSVIWWHCYPLGFVDAEQTSIDGLHHRLPQLTNWLDYVIQLGANGLLLAPIFSSRTHGYDTVDHFRIDPRLGDQADFDELLEQAHRRGIKVVLDGVFNHVSVEHEIVGKAKANGPDSADGGWVRWVGEYVRGFEGNLDLVELNLDNPAVQDYIVQVMDHWLDRGIDGWRLDAAYSPGAEAWAPIVTRVKKAHPDSWILAEVIHGDYVEFQSVSGVDSITQYELWKAVWSSLVDRNPHELAWTLKRHAEFCQHFEPQTFIGNHDVTRIATTLDDPARLRLAIALLLLLPGIPSIYAGDEQGFTGQKTDGPRGDDAVRPAFPADPGELAPFGAWIFTEHQRLVHLRRSHPWLVSAELEVTDLSDAGIGIELSTAGKILGLALNFSDQPTTIEVGGQRLAVGPVDWALSE